MDPFERLVEKLRGEDIVILGLAGGVLGIIGLVAMFSLAPYAGLGVLTLVFLAWAGIRTGLFKKEKKEEEAPLDALNRRYAEGVISEEEWQRKHDNLVQAEEEEREKELV